MIGMKRIRLLETKIQGFDLKRNIDRQCSAARSTPGTANPDRKTRVRGTRRYTPPSIELVRYLLLPFPGENWKERSVKLIAGSESTPITDDVRVFLVGRSARHEDGYHRPPWDIRDIRSGIVERKTIVERATPGRQLNRHGLHISE